MASYFKDVTNYISSLYPDSDVYVISDEHFFHQNILTYTRKNFDSLEEMNEHIVERHNSVVKPNDVVIFLGDFCFYKNEISGLLSKLNGHKFLILGNHDKEKILYNYKKFGFEDVFALPVKFNDDFLSHYALLGDRPKNSMYDLLVREFKGASGINYHGHEHDIGGNYDHSVNVACENVDYTPLLIGRTSVDSKRAINILKDKNLIDYVIKKCNISYDLLVKDFIYALMLDSIGDFKDDTVFFGSYPIFKKFGYASNFSDLDGSVIYNPNLSEKRNRQVLIKACERVYFQIKDVEGFNVDFLKRIGNMCILSNVFTTGNGYYAQTYLDMNTIMLNIYRQSDFTTLTGTSILGDCCKKFSLIDEPMPSFDVRILDNLGLLTNLILQYLYQNDVTKKKEIMRKIRCIVKNMSIGDIYKLESLEDYFIRYLIRNIIFLRGANRQGEYDNYHLNEFLLENLYRELNGKLPSNAFDFLIDGESDYNYAYRKLITSGFDRVTSVSKEILQ